MTTTSTFLGMDPEGKSSSRVLAPPGGGSSNIFGHDDSPQNRRNPQNINKGTNDIFGNKEPEVAGASPGKRHNPQNVNCGDNDIFHQKAHGAAAQPKSRAPRSEYNPITGEPYPTAAPKEEKKEEEQVAAEKGAGEPVLPQRVQPSTRVSQPPGGASTKLW